MFTRRIGIKETKVKKGACFEKEEKGRGLDKTGTIYKGGKSQEHHELQEPQKDLRDVRKEEEKFKGEVSDLNKAQEELWDAIAMSEMKQRESNLCFRSVPETLGEDIKNKLISEIAQWLNMQQEEIANAMQSAFRIKAKSTKAKKHSRGLFDYF